MLPTKNFRFLVQGRLVVGLDGTTPATLAKKVPPLWKGLVV